MFNVLLQTKLYLPPVRPDWVPRPRLLNRLAIKPQTKLILISAPAGYGKTSLVTSWITRLQLADVPDASHVCWLSLDEGDSDPQQFFRYLATAVSSLPNVAASLPQLRQAPNPLPAQTLMQAFLHDIIPVTAPFLLVLDDYHVLDSADIDAALNALMDRMPPQMTLVLTSRSDPGFPISRLRARGQLIELRADDLRFTEAEVAQFLQQTMGLTLQPEQIAALENRTEGWIAGLQMAALSMQNRAAADRDAFVNGFTGSHRFVLDYLVEEALQQQREEVRTFLLATSILDRLSGPLCTAVTQNPRAQQLLETLERDNLFVVPLDDERRWYRYHHLFADVLRAQARTSHPEQLAGWHAQAASWFAEQDALPQAIPHALAANAMPLAAHLLEQLRFQIDGTYQIRQWLGWATQLSAEQVQKRPVLSAGYGWALLENGDMAAAEPYLRQAERWLASPAAEMVISDEAQWRVLPASLANARAYRLLAQGDVAGATQQAQQALDFFPSGELNIWRQVALSLLGVTHWIAGDVPASAQAFAQSMADNLQAGKLEDAISNAFVLAEFQIMLGQLHQADQTINRMMQLAVQPEAPLPLGADDLYRMLAYLAWERGDGETAVSHLHTALQASESGSFINGRYRLYLLQATFKKQAGDFAAALALLDEAESVFVENPLPVVRPIAALRADIWIAQGDLAQAQAWAAARQLTADAEVHYLREFELMTLARLLLAQFRQQQDATALDQAVSLLDRLAAAAEAGQRLGTVMRLKLLQARALAARDGNAAAMPLLARALALAEPQGMVNSIVAEGEEMVGLLQTAVSQNIAPDYATRLLAALGETADPPPQPLIDPLSERELEILALIAAGLKNKEIAEQLFISLNTVLYHNKNIYSKLGVSKRTVAVSKARELGLV